MQILYTFGSLIIIIRITVVFTLASECECETSFSFSFSSMASHRSGEDANANAIILPIRFFKAILKSNRQTLQIPNKFTKIYGEGLPNPVFMKPPDGTQWEVYWTKQNGELWFQKGWKEFVEHYSLDHGHLVFFNYEGTSQIPVLIYHQSSALEIHYPSSGQQNNHESVQVLEEGPHKNAEENDNNLDLVHSNDKSVQVLDDGPDQNAVENDDNLVHSDDDNESVQDLDDGPGQNAIKMIGGHEGSLSMNWPKEGRAQELTRKFISCNPFFTVSIKAYHLEQYMLHVPDMESYIGKRKNVRLEIGEKSWNVKLPNRNMLSGGWCSFARDNELQKGDVCIFELVCTKHARFNVHVFKIPT